MRLRLELCINLNSKLITFVKLKEVSVKINNNVTLTNPHYILYEMGKHYEIHTAFPQLLFHTFYKWL